MIDIYDFDNCPLSDRNGSYGGKSGSKEGLLIGDEYWIIKYPQSTKDLVRVGSLSYTTSPQSEYIGSHIYEILGIEAHATVLGVRNDQLVVACRDLCDDEHRLVEFRQLKNTYNRELNRELDKNMTSTGSSHIVNLEEVITHLRYNPELKNVLGLKEHFWNSVVVDGLINNNDRNNGNWGLLVSKSEKIACPVYDNGSAFSPKIPESRIRKKLDDKNMLISSVRNDITAYSLDGEHNARFSEIMALDMEKYPDLKAAVERIVPRARDRMGDINAMIDDIPEEIAGIAIMSPERKEVYKEEIKARYDMVLEPTLNQALELDKDKQWEYGDD